MFTSSAAFSSASAARSPSTQRPNTRSTRGVEPLPSGEVTVLRRVYRSSTPPVAPTWEWLHDPDESEALTGLSPAQPSADEDDPCWPEAIAAAMQALCGDELGLHRARELAYRIVEHCIAEGSAEHSQALERMLPRVTTRQNRLRLLGALAAFRLPLSLAATSSWLLGLLGHPDRMIAVAAAHALAACAPDGLEAVKRALDTLDDPERRAILETFVEDILIPELEGARRDEHP